MRFLSARLASASSSGHTGWGGTLTKGTSGLAWVSMLGGVVMAGSGLTAPGRTSAEGMHRQG